MTTLLTYLQITKAVTEAFYLNNRKAKRDLKLNNNCERLRKTECCEIPSGFELLKWACFQQLGLDSIAFELMLGDSILPCKNSFSHLTGNAAPMNKPQTAI